VVVLCNAGPWQAIGLPHLIAREILAAMLPKWKQTDEPPEPSVKFIPPPELIGNWTGKLVTYKSGIPLTLHVFDSGDVHAQLGKQMTMLWNAVHWRDGYLSGSMPGDIGTEDAARHPYNLDFTLKLRGGILNGPASAVPKGAGRVGGAQTQWVELKKQ